MRIGMKRAIFLCVGIVAFSGAKAFSSGTTEGKSDSLPAAKAQQRVSDSARKTLPPPVTVPPDSAAADSLSPKKYSFRVVTEPAGASVLLDDSLRGESPCVITGATAGGHVLTLKKKGFYLKRAEIEVDSIPDREFSFTLLQPGLLRIESTPPGAEVSLDGKKEGVTPYENDKVKPGEHSVKVELKQYVPFERTLSIANGGRDSLRCTLEHTAAYTDLVAESRRLEKRANTERKVFGIASALFCLGTVLMVLVEMADNK